MENDQAQLGGNNVAPKAAEPEAWKEHCLAAERAFEQARFGEAAAHYESALRELEAFGFSDPRFASTLNSLAGVYGAQHRYDETESLYRHVLALRKSAFGPQSIQVAQTLNDLAALYAAACKWAEAERSYKEALVIAEAARGPEDISLCAGLNNLALLYKNEQRTDEALPLFQRALRIGLKAFGQAHPFVATSLNNLAAICVDRGKYAEAEALFKQSLDIKEKSDGPQHPDVATVLNNLGELYWATSRASEAKALFERVLRIDEAAWGPRHPEVAADLMRLASMAEAEGDDVEAERLYQHAVEIRESSLGRNHPMTVKSLGKLNAIYQKQGRGGEAGLPAPATEEPGRKPAAPGKSEHAIQAAPSTSDAEAARVPRLHPAATPDAKRDVAEMPAARPQALVLAMPATEPGLSRPGAAQSLCELADRAASDGRWLDAESLYRRELEIEQSMRGVEDACVAATLNNLGLVKRSQGNLEEAAGIFQSSLAIWVNLREHPRVAVVLNNLAVVCAEQKKHADAEALYRKSVQVHKSAAGSREDQLAVIAANLAALGSAPVSGEESSLSGE
ncbi:MAG: tetratricopeptide repeat protein [Terriglobia bacterium]